MFMWRDLAKNCRQDTVRWVLDKLLAQFRRVERQYNYIGFVVGPFPTIFRDTGKRGYQIDVEFAMWGDSFEEAMQRFSDVVLVMDQSIKRCEAKL